MLQFLHLNKKKIRIEDSELLHTYFEPREFEGKDLLEEGAASKLSFLNRNASSPGRLVRSTAIGQQGSLSRRHTNTLDHQHYHRSWNEHSLRKMNRAM